MLEEDKDQVNVQMDADLARKLDEMRAQDDRTRSSFMRWLIQQEWDRRNPVEDAKPKTGELKSKKPTDKNI